MANEFDFPYQPPRAVDRPSLPPGAKPPVWTWYVVYCALMALMYFGLMAMGVVYMVLPAEAFDNEADKAVFPLVGGMLLVLGGAFFLLYAIAPFLPRRKAAWIYGFVTIGIGMTSACCLPATIPLMIFWIKPETRAYFGA